MLDRGKTIEYLGLLAVVISVLFVAFEIRQSNRIAVGTTSYDIQRNYMAINEILTSDVELSNLVVKIEAQDIELTEPERVRARAFGRRLLIQWISIEEAYESGLLSENVYQTGIDDVKSVAGRSGYHPLFQSLFSAYDVSHYEILKPLLAAPSP